MDIKILAVLLLLSPLALADQQLAKGAGQMTLQELLESHGIKSGQVALILIAPIDSRQSLGGRSLYGRQAGPVIVQAPSQPVQVHYKSQSAPLDVKHTHIPAPKPETKLSRSEEEPHLLVHEIIRPVVQHVREIIQPYRKIVQEIRPVQETVETKVARQPASKPKTTAASGRTVSQ